MDAVRRYDVLDTPPDGAFDRLTALAAKHFEVPIAIVSIVDTDRIWFKSHHGVEGVEQIDRVPGLCASAILHVEPWVVENAAADPRALANPLVAGELGLRFYAGAPLTTGDGHNLGTLCVIDTEPREFGADQVQTLKDMAAIVMDELELRLSARRAVELAATTARALQESLLPPALPTIEGAELAALYLPADKAIVGGDFYDAVPLGSDRWVLAVGDVSGKGAQAAGVTALARHTVRTAALTSHSPPETLRTLNDALFVGHDEGMLPPHYCTALVMFVQRSAEGFEIVASAAGHPPAIVLSGGAATELRASGTPAGWYRGTTYDQVHAVLRPGDALVAYTDGLTEARGPDGLLGMSGLKEALGPDRPARAGELIERLRHTVDRPEIRVRDDVAALAISLRAG